MITQIQIKQSNITDSIVTSNATSKSIQLQEIMS